MAHIAVVGTGRVGSALAYTLAFQHWVKCLTLTDINEKLARMTAEEICHAMAMNGYDTEIQANGKASEIEGADIIVICAGTARTPGMSRRDLAAKNAGIVKQIVVDTLDNNSHAKYFVITNPVDAMATLAEHVAEGRAEVIGTGTCLETVRFRTALARELKVQARRIECYVGGEHGESSVPIWSMVSIEGIPLLDYLRAHKIALDFKKCEEYVRNISVAVIEGTGGTRWGPAGAFTEVLHGLVCNTGRVLAFSRSRVFEGIPIPVHVTVPGKIGTQNSFDIWSYITAEEREKIASAAHDIYETYRKIEGTV